MNHLQIYYSTEAHPSEWGETRGVSRGCLSNRWRGLVVTGGWVIFYALSESDGSEGHSTIRVLLLLCTQVCVPSICPAGSAVLLLQFVW